MFKVGFSETKKSFIFHVVLTESCGNGTQESICHLCRVVTAHFILLLPNVAEENKYDFHENERVLETHFLYGWLHIRDVSAQAKVRQTAGSIILQPFAQSYDNVDFDELVEA